MAYVLLVMSNVTDTLCDIVIVCILAAARTAHPAGDIDAWVRRS